MSEAGNGTMDSLILEGLKRAAAGLPRNGRPVSDLDRLLAQGGLVSLVAKPKGAGSLYSLVNGLLTEAMFDASLSETLGSMTWTAVDNYFKAVITDIVSGRLIVREPLNMLRCNEIPEMQALSNARDAGDCAATLVRFVVKFSEFRAWLDWHGLKVPDWACFAEPPSLDESIVGCVAITARWSDSLTLRSRKLRLQFDIVERLLASRGYPPFAIPYGGVAALQEECQSDYSEAFNKPTSFENCWEELKKSKLVRVADYLRFCGKDDEKTGC